MRNYSLLTNKNTVNYLKYRYQTATAIAISTIVTTDLIRHDATFLTTITPIMMSNSSRA
jgi:hypothetical protein